MSILRIGQVECPCCHHHFEPDYATDRPTSIKKVFVCTKCGCSFRKRYKKAAIVGLLLTPVAIYAMIFLVAHLDGASDNLFNLVWFWPLIFGFWAVYTSWNEIVDGEERTSLGDVKCPSCLKRFERFEGSIDKETKKLECPYCHVMLEKGYPTRVKVVLVVFLLLSYLIQYLLGKGFLDAAWALYLFFGMMILITVWMLSLGGWIKSSDRNQ